MAEEDSMLPQVDSEGGFERVRKKLSWLTIAAFAASFTALLVLSATPHWGPNNPLIDLCDRVWRISGLLALLLGTIPYVRRVVRKLSGLFTGG